MRACVLAPLLAAAGAAAVAPTCGAKDGVRQARLGLECMTKCKGVWGGKRPDGDVCDWCGPKGVCCKRGTSSAACDGRIGGAANHACACPAGAGAPRPAPAPQPKPAPGFGSWTTSPPVTAPPTTSPPVTASPTTSAPTEWTSWTTSPPATSPPVTSPPATSPPTVGMTSWTKPMPIVEGDPFTSYGGKSTQFYMPLREEMGLLACGKLELHGRAMGSSVPGDQQQWFDMFKVHHAGKHVLTVETRATMPLMSSTGTVTSSAENAESVDIGVVAKKDRVKAALEQLKGVQTRALSTLAVNIEGRVLAATATTTAAGGAVNVAVVQDAARRIGSGYVETVGVDVDGVSMQMQSSPAAKFAVQADRIRHMHIDLTFLQLNATACTGPLPEIWGVRPVSASTARLLLPPQ